MSVVPKKIIKCPVYSGCLTTAKGPLFMRVLASAIRVKDRRRNNKPRKLIAAPKTIIAEMITIRRSWKSWDAGLIPIDCMNLFKEGTSLRTIAIWL